MLSFEWISWLGDTVKVIGDLVPRHLLIEPSQKGVKFKGMTEVVILEPGRHWYIPYFSKVRMETAAQQTLYLGKQHIVTKDGTNVYLETSILFRVEDFEIATTEFASYENQVDDDARSVVVGYFNSLDYQSDVVGKLDIVTKRLTYRLRKKLAKYGIKVLRLQVGSIGSGISLLHIGNDK